MEIVLVVVVILGFIIHAFLMRHFFLQLLAKLQQPAQAPQAAYTPMPQAQKTLHKFPWQEKTIPNMADAPMKNDVMNEDDNEVDFDENTPLTGIPNFKIDVEGGDTQVPPEFEATTQ